MAAIRTNATISVRVSCFRCLSIAPLGIATRIARIHRFFSFSERKFSTAETQISAHANSAVTFAGSLTGDVAAAVAAIASR